MKNKLTRIQGDKSLDTLRDNFEKQLKTFKRASGRGNREEKRKKLELKFYELISAVAANFDKDLDLCSWLTRNYDVLTTHCEKLPMPESDEEDEEAADNDNNNKSEELVERLKNLLSKLNNVNNRITDREIKLADQKKGDDDTSYSLLWSFVKGAFVVTAVVVVATVLVKLVKEEDSDLSNSMPSVGEAGVGALMGLSLSGAIHSNKHDGEIRHARKERSIYTQRIGLLKTLAEFHDKAKEELEQENVTEVNNEVK